MSKHKTPVIKFSDWDLKEKNELLPYPLGTQVGNVMHLQELLTHANHLCSVQKKNLDGLNRKLNEERAQHAEQIKLRDEALVELRKEAFDQERNAYDAGVRNLRASMNQSNVSYDEWKRGQK